MKNAEASVNEVHARVKNKSSPGEYTNRCGRCGPVHGFKNCPAWGKLCLKCRGRNHFKNYCKTKTVKEIIESEEGDDEYVMDTVAVGNIDKADNEYESEWFSTVKCNDSRVRVKLDSGAGTNCIPMKTFKKIKPKPQLIPSKTVLNSDGGNKINHFGKCKIILKANGKVQTDDFYVTETTSPPILGLTSCQKLGLLKKVDMVDHKENLTSITKDIIAKEFKDMFEGLGCFEQADHTELKSDGAPVCEPPRRVPFTLRESLKINLESMEEQGVIKKVDKPTE